jgi:hypothetical protein
MRRTIMAVGLNFEQASNPAYTFAAAEPFVRTFGDHVGARDLNPAQRPMEYAEFVLRNLQPRAASSVFNDKDRPVSEGFADRYAQADQSMPAWVMAHEAVIFDTAHELGVRDRELGTTMDYPFPQGEFALAVALEGANDQNYGRGAAIAEEIKAGNLKVDSMVVAVTDRKVGEKEGYGLKEHFPDLKVGHAVGALTVARLYSDYPDVFGGPNGVPLSAFNVSSHFADTRQTMAEVASVLRPRSIVMSGSKIYGSWMSADLATTQHLFPAVKEAHFGAGPDNPKAARTTRIWTAEVAQALVSAAHLQHARNTKKR